VVYSATPAIDKKSAPPKAAPAVSPVTLATDQSKAGASNDFDPLGAFSKTTAPKEIPTVSSALSRPKSKYNM